ncbi:MAG: hypothetical protein R3B47_11465 [Bacteroidia bacterium]
MLDTLLQYFRIHGKLPKAAIGDRGFRAPKTVLGVQIISPDKPSKDKSAYQNEKLERASDDERPSNPA